MRISLQLIIILLVVSHLSGQNLLIEKFIPLNFSATGFSVNENKKFILLIAKEYNEIIKIDLNGNVQKIVGGFGWNEGQFDYPSCIVSTAIDVYVSDYNNHRIQRFDHNLNHISSLQKNEQINFEYPLSISLSTKGDLYILDALNRRIVKINGFNRLERIFGNYESGTTILSNPTIVKVDNQQQVYVLDGNKIIVFDQFGIYLKTISLPESFPENLIDFYPEQSSIFLLTEKNLYELQEEMRKFNFLNEFDLNHTFKKIEIKQRRIYILSSEGILIGQKEY